MALRVLLADESTTIKRVMQLALQDFAVEVKAVPIGMDVLPVTKAFKPDIIFADVLLPKKSGYEVGKELKSDPETKHIPLVLMWSGFMELDETKAKESMAERRLEKPFEPDTLRALIKELVKRTQTNPVSAFLKFPTLPDIQEDLHTIKDPVTNEIPSHELQEVEEDWSHQDLSKFKIELSTDEEQPVTSHKFSIPTDDIEKPQINSFGEFDEITFAKAPTQGPTSISTSPASSGLIDHESILREEARKIIENIAWKIIPEITERIVREEINKLLQDTEKSISVP